MSEAQLYLAIGMPSLVALIGILVNVSYFIVLNTRMNNLESKFDTRFDMMMSKLMEVDNRLTRVEEHLGK
ncbi:MAG: hypothetical protein ACRD7E_30495 [Bryobacteraceae bacterium]